MVPGPSRSQIACSAAGSSQAANPLDSAVNPIPARVACRARCGCMTSSLASSLPNLIHGMSLASEKETTARRYAPGPEDVWSWSRWRRLRQYQARLYHYRHRGYALT